MVRCSGGSFLGEDEHGKLQGTEGEGGRPDFGDREPVSEAVFEMRVHVGPGYRAYFTRRAEVVYLLLLGGDKSSQKRDIKRAIEMARALHKE